jgi:hypothetical protein
MTHAVIGNHDVAGTNLTLRPDGLAAFYFFTAPTNGPAQLRWAPPLTGARDQTRLFRQHAGPAFPGLSFYSFDNGPVHCVVLDLNPYVGAIESAVRTWLERDLSTTSAPWKFVFCHQPGFHTSEKHYREQPLRLLQPLFESHGVTLVFSGHAHNYQRSKPLRFAPVRLAEDGAVDGRFELDEEFDGRERTVPRGVIHIVTGAGGAETHDTQATPQQRGEAGLNWAPFTARFDAGRHSYTRVRVTPQEVHLRQIDHQGNVVDEIRIRR